MVGMQRVWRCRGGSGGDVGDAELWQADNQTGEVEKDETMTSGCWVMGERQIDEKWTVVRPRSLLM